ncbi:hypothetical protein D3874_20065 [Oleomonas cavernae]|uniref:Uncharacterized protein n=1 Tax=Oleomonas cavernae TaxID=2320859 RepID=A0A418WG23_9PROT|nr:hypothetical protein [Oleomonas cavernae]RJF88985.1 hypothetical protein D3874_20065 [Oleomonas cavernae]
MSLSFKHRLAIGLTALMLPLAGTAHAEGLVKASEQSLQAVGAVITAGTAVVGYSVAIPLIAVGELGQAVGGVGTEIADGAAAITPLPQPLPVSDQSVTAGPRPDVALAR